MISSTFTRDIIISPTGSDMYIQASFTWVVSIPIRCKGHFNEEEEKSHPLSTCFSPNCNPTTKTSKEITSRISVIILTILEGKKRKSISIDTNPPQRYALGAIRPVIHNIKKRAASSGQGRAEFNPYLKKTWIRIMMTISPIATVASWRPSLRRIVLKPTSNFKRKIIFSI